MTEETGGGGVRVGLVHDFLVDVVLSSSSARAHGVIPAERRPAERAWQA